MFQSTFDTWKQLIEIATETIDVSTFFFSLHESKYCNKDPQGEQILNDLVAAGTKRHVKIRLVQSVPTDQFPDTETDIFVRQKAAEVRSVDINGGVMHTKLWIVDNKHVYIGSANMDCRAISQVQ